MKITHEPPMAFSDIDKGAMRVGKSPKYSRIFVLNAPESKLFFPKYRLSRLHHLNPSLSETQITHWHKSKICKADKRRIRYAARPSQWHENIKIFDNISADIWQQQ